MIASRRRGSARRTATVNEQVLLDNFTITTLAAGTSQFSNHGPDVGNGWVQHPLYNTRGISMDSSGPGRLYPTGGTSSTACYYAVPMPPHADVDVSGWFDRVTVAANEAPGVCARCHPTLNTMLIARYNAATDQVEFIELSAGTALQTLTFAGTAWALSSENKLTIRPRGNQASVLLNGVQVIAPTTVTVTANNYAAVRLGLGAASGAASGIHVRKFEAVDFGNLGASAGSEPGPDHSTYVRRRPLPGKLNQRNSLNGVAFIQSTAASFNGFQYAVWVNDQRKPIIGKRALPNGDWTSTFDLSTVAGNPLDTMTLEDSHNTYSVGIGSDGYIHVSGNHHDVALNYVRSTNPEDISAWVTTGAPTSGLTSSITYPQFLPLPGGNLLLFTRNGVSGNGDMRVAKWNSTTHAWGAATKFIDGNPTSESPYVNLPCVGRDGTVHVFYCWRSSAGGGNDNQDICHIKSTDEGATWRDMAGNAISLPVLHGTSPLIVDTAASGSGLLNQCGADVDVTGRPHAGFFLYDGNGKTQVQHIWHDGTAWRNDTVTSWTYTHNLNVGVVDAVIARPQVFCPNDGSTWMLLRHNVDKAGRYFAVDVTPGRPVSADRVVWRSTSYYHEATVDTATLRGFNELHFLLAPSAPVAASNADMGLVRWQSVNGWIVQAPVVNLPLLPAA